MEPTPDLGFVKGVKGLLLGLALVSAVILAAVCSSRPQRSVAPDPAPPEHFDLELVSPPPPGAPAPQAPEEPVPPPPLAPPTAGAWSPQGPSPTQSGQVENVTPNNEVIGAIHALAADPTNANILFIGAVNGGVWRTTNATAASPTWTPLTDSFPSQSIGALEMDPGNPNVLLAGIGRFSSFGGAGGPLTGLLLSVDGGNNWTQIDDPLLQNANISSVYISGTLLMAGANFFFAGGGLFRSNDGGANWNQISGTGGLPAGGISDLVADPTNANRFYASVVTGGGGRLFRSDDAGVNWANVSQNDATLNAAITAGTVNNVEMAVATNARIYTGVLQAGQLAYVGFSDNQGAAWTAMDIPRITVNTGNFGINPRLKPGGQGAIHFSIRADPNTATTVYVGGDRQPHLNEGTNNVVFPNFIGANNFSGNLWRGTTTVAPTGAVPSPQWNHLTHSNAIAAIPNGGTANSSSPHADSREMVFDANGNIIEVDDGGVYRRTNPANNTGDWFSINGNLQVTEFHDIGYDTVSNILMGGAQDTGTHQQNATGGTTWTDIHQGDGGDVAVDDTSVANQSIRYSSFQFLGAFRRRTYNSANGFLGEVFPALNVASGANPQFPFVTPVELNATDQTRLILGANNGIYESNDMGNNINQRTGANQAFGESAMAYGNVTNADLIYVGTGAQVRVRTTAGGNFAATAGQPAGGGQNIADVIMDPANGNVLYASDSNQVFQSPDGGATWTDITGSLGSDGAGNFQQMAYIPGSGGQPDRVAIGTNAGVYVSPETALGFWFPFGTALPDGVLAFDLDYDAADDTLLAGLLGRGAWTLSGASQIPLIPELWGICENKATLFSFGDYTDPLNTFVNYGRLLYDDGGTLDEVGDGVEAFALDTNGDAYTATDEPLAGLGAPVLLRINVNAVRAGNLEATVVGRIDIPFDSDDDISGLSIDQVTGQLYALHRDDGDSVPDKLLLIDKTNGSVITDFGGITGLGETVAKGEDMISDLQGNLYVTDDDDDELYRVTPVGGLNPSANIIQVVDANEPGGLPAVPAFKLEGLAWDPVNDKLIGTETRNHFLAEFTLSDGNNTLIDVTTVLGLTDSEGLAFVP